LARPRHFTTLYVGAVLSYMTLIIGVAQAPTALLAGAALLSTGLANSGFSVMQATLIYLAAPAAMRSRLYGVLSLCIGSGLVGFVNIGLMAEWVGAPWATTISGIEGLVAMALTWRWRRCVRHAASLPGAPRGAPGPNASRSPFAGRCANLRGSGADKPARVLRQGGACSATSSGGSSRPSR
jgi:MFS family permease